MLATHQKSANSRQAARSLLAGACAVLLSFSAQVSFAADTASSTYQQDRKFCMSSQSLVDQKACLQEAGAARAAARNGNLSEATTSYEQNAMARCKALPPADQSDCARRINGQGAASGSVLGGGVIRETSTTIIESPPSTLPPSDVMPQRTPHQMQHQMPR
tara:strand:- start:974691 stop:975173 length:483 start_codon:yes stop_codon:yes gene_type:complete